MKRLSVLVLVFALLFSTSVPAAEWKAGAAGWEWHADNAELYTGTYRISSIMGIDFDHLAAITGDAEADSLKNLIVLTLNGDGTASFTSEDDTIPLIWNVTGQDILLLPQTGAAEEKDVLRGTIADGIIFLNDDEMPFILAKDGADTQAFLMKQQGIPAPVNDGVIAGTYKLYDVMGLSVAEFAAMMGATLEEAQNSMVIRLNADGTGAIAADGDIQPFSWTAQDGAVIIADGTDTLSCPVSGGILVLPLDGETVSLAKVIE